MSDILVVLSSEIWGALLELVHENHGLLSGMKVWGDGHAGETLKMFLDRNLSEMSYDENVHIVTGVKLVELDTRCPYPHHKHTQAERAKRLMTDRKIIGDDGDTETACVHGIGHGGRHTCDGCCTGEWPL